MFQRVARPHSLPKYIKQVQITKYLIQFSIHLKLNEKIQSYQILNYMSN